MNDRSNFIFDVICSSLFDGHESLIAFENIVSSLYVEYDRNEYVVQEMFRYTSYRNNQKIPLIHHLLNKKYVKYTDIIVKYVKQDVKRVVMFCHEIFYYNDYDNYEDKSFYNDLLFILDKFGIDFLFDRTTITMKEYYNTLIVDVYVFDAIIHYVTHRQRSLIHSTLCERNRHWNAYDKFIHKMMDILSNHI